MAVLITGGSGFVGLNIASALLEQGRDVVLFGPDAPPPVASAHLGELPGRFAVERGDVREPGAIADVLRRHGIDRIVHGAAITAALEREAQQARAIAEVNLVGTIEVLEAALAARVSRVIVLGTGAIFGARPGATDPIRETDTPLPESLYGITKYAAERTALRYRDTRGLDLAVARLGVVFGRWEYDTGLRDTLSLPLRALEIAEAGGKARFRAGLPGDWVYASDVADAILRMLDAATLPNALYQIATGGGWSLERWCERLRGAYPGFAYEMVADEAEADLGRMAPPARPPFSIARLRADFGFEPRFREAEAFDDYIAWRRDHAGFGHASEPS